MRSVRLGDYDLPTKERAREALRHFLDSEQIACAKRSPQRMVVRSIYRVIVKAAKRAGIAGVHPHILRHSCATHCLNRGMDIWFVQELLGHTNMVTTAKYLHVATANLHRVHAKFFPRV